MSKRICNETFLNFYKNYNSDVVSKKEMLDNLAEVFQPLAEELGYVYCAVDIDAPDSLYDDFGLVERFVLYGLEMLDKEETRHSRNYITAEGGLFKFIVCVSYDYEWDADDEANLDFVAKTILVILGRARVMNILRYTEEHDSLSAAYTLDGIVKPARKLMSMNPEESFDCLYLNIKNFKYINDKASQIGGNLAIGKYTRVIMKELAKDGIVARAGGDNFAIILKHSRLDSFLEFLKTIKIDIDIDGKHIVFDMPCRAGIFYGNEFTPVNMMLYKSSIALSSLMQQRNIDYLEYDPEQEKSIQNYRQIMNRFPNALQKREFAVFYQPKINIQNRKMIGAEALVRWFDNGKFISPIEFIPILEREGCISYLDYYVFEKACSDIRSWLDAGIEPVRISTNFSKDNLKNVNLISDVLEIMNRYDVDGRYLEIELTELCDYQDLDILCNFVREMQANGVNISIDDFGKGYSSFELIKKLGMNVIKIDKSLIDNICEKGSPDEILIKYIVRMLTDLNKDVIAEGVETAEQAAILESIGCSHIQGYLFDRPLPQYEFERRLQDSDYYANV